MKKAAMVLCIVFLCAQSGFCENTIWGFSPLVNEISIFQNASDSGENFGQTLQIVSINSIKIGSWFNVEFTADFNRKFTEGKDNDYYLEFGLVKPVWKKVSANYQRIHGTFMSKPVNQFGIRVGF